MNIELTMNKTTAATKEKSYKHNWENEVVIKWFWQLISGWAPNNAIAIGLFSSAAVR